MPFAPAAAAPSDAHGVHGVFACATEGGGERGNQNPAARGHAMLTSPSERHPNPLVSGGPHRYGRSWFPRRCPPWWSTVTAGGRHSSSTSTDPPGDDGRPGGDRGGRPSADARVGGARDRAEVRAETPVVVPPVPDRGVRPPVQVQRLGLRDPGQRAPDLRDQPRPFRRPVPAVVPPGRIVALLGSGIERWDRTDPTGPDVEERHRPGAELGPGSDLVRV